MAVLAFLALALPAHRVAGSEHAALAWQIAGGVLLGALFGIRRSLKRGRIAAFFGR